MLSASVYLIVFRIIHIMAGVAWAGSAFFLVVFLQPSAASVGPAAGPFMMELLGRRRLIDWILRIAGFTILGGAFLYWHDWQISGSLGNWLGTAQGKGITLGAVSAIVAFLIGMFATRPGVEKMLALNREAMQGGGPPSPEMAQQIGRQQMQLRNLARANLFFVAIAVLAMATARYW